MSLHVGAVLTFLAWAEAFELERQTVLTWNHDAFRRVLANNKAERPYLRAGRAAAMKGLTEFVEVVYLHDRDRYRHAKAAAVLLRSDRDRYLALRARQMNGASR
jgi:hypothetical protein